MYKIGIDIGGMSAKIGIVRNGEIKALRTTPTNSNTEYEHFLTQIFSVIDELISEQEEPYPEMIGISSFGLIDTVKGKIIYANNIKWEDKCIVKDFEGRYQVPVRIANDAKCASLGEAVIGAGKDYNRVCMITIGTGVGGGFIVGKKLDMGDPHTDASGILGHLTIAMDGRQCTCGRKGCLEAYASATAIMNLYKEKTGVNITAKELFDFVRNGETTAVEVFEQFKLYLGDGLVSISNILRPEIIVIGGGVSKSADLFINFLEDYVNEHIFGGEAVQVKITVAKLGNDAGIIGATLLN